MQIAFKLIPGVKLLGRPTVPNFSPPHPLSLSSILPHFLLSLSLSLLPRFLALKILCISIGFLPKKRRIFSLKDAFPSLQIHSLQTEGIFKREREKERKEERERKEGRKGGKERKKERERNKHLPLFKMRCKFLLSFSL